MNGSLGQVGPLAAAVTTCVIGQVLYHVLIRGLDAAASPYLVIGVAYFVGLVIMCGAGVVDSERQNLHLDQGTVWRAAGIGVGIALVELGYVFAYRFGLPLSIGPVTVLAITTVALIPIAVLAFSDGLRPQVLLGVVVTVAGLWLIAK